MLYTGGHIVDLDLLKSTQGQQAYARGTLLSSPQKANKRTPEALDSWCRSRVVCAVRGWAAHLGLAGS